MLLWSKYYDGAVPCRGLIYPGTISRVDVCPPARGIVEIFVFACHVHALGHSSSKESLLDDVSPFLEQPTTLSRNNETKTQPVMAVHQWCCRSPRIDRPTGNEHLILCSPAGHGVLSHIHTCRVCIRQHMYPSYIPLPHEPTAENTASTSKPPLHPPPASKVPSFPFCAQRCRRLVLGPYLICWNARFSRVQ